MALTPTRSSTSADWASSNPVLANSEVGIETDTGVVKQGDGSTAWLSLPIADKQETSSQLAASLSNESGTGNPVFTTGATLTNPILVSPVSTTPIVSTGNDTSSGTAVSSPAVSSGVAFTPSTTKNAQVVFQLAGVTGSYSITYGSTTGAENAVATSVPTLLNVGDVISFMVPKGWKVVITLTTVTLTATLVTTF